MSASNQIKELVKFTYGLKLLFVEDSEDVREQTTQFLNNFFGDIVVCENGKEGFKAFKEKHFDVIITDLNMPVMGGMDMIKKIRQENSSIPILILSAHNEKRIIEETKLYNINGYIIKPIYIENYIDMLSKIKELNYKA